MIKSLVLVFALLLTALCIICIGEILWWHIATMSILVFITVAILSIHLSASIVYEFWGGDL